MKASAFAGLPLVAAAFAVAAASGTRQEVPGARQEVPGARHDAREVEQDARAAMQVPDGAVLTKALGCGACHTGVPEGDAIREMAPPFGEGAAPLAPAFIFHYLDDPQTVRPEIAPARMPRYDLDERERVALALFVTDERELRGVDDAFRAAMARHPEADRAEGRVLFETLNCGGCHAHPDIPPRLAAPDLGATGLRVQEEWLRDYLARPVTIRPAGASPGRGDRMPDFRLDPAETAAITEFLLTLRTPTPGEPAARAGAPPSPGEPAARAGAPPTPGEPAARAGVPPSPGDRPPPAQLPSWAPLALSPFAMQKAETLVEERWSCLGCHQLGEEGGRIGPRLDGVAQRLRPEYVRHLIENPAHLAPGTIMPASLEQPDRMDLVASYLLLRDAPWTGSERVRGLPAMPAAGDPGRGAGNSASAASDPGAAAADPASETGAALYESHCAACHGPEGGGDGFNAPFLPVAPTVHADSAAMSLRTDDTLYDGIHAGGRILGKSHRMPAFGASLDHTQKRALVAHIRTLCRCLGPAWSRDGRRGR